ncbi:MAG: hypothetical protein AB1637_09620, partial [Elusimicrobiota bacterium]
MVKNITDIQKSLKKIFIKVILLNLLILIFLVISSLFYTAYFKQRIAEHLSDSFRTPLLNGDNRLIMMDMSRSVLKDFSGLVWTSIIRSNNFSIPENYSATNLLFTGVSEVKIFFDENRTSEYGKLRFYYNRWTYFIFALLFWIFIFLLSIKIAFMERKRLIEEYNLLMNSEINKYRADLAAQVAHDIRSPLAALESGLKDAQVTQGNKELINNALKRINSIA